MEQKQEFMDLNNTLNRLQDKENLNKEEINKKKELESKLIEYLECKAKGAQIRARTQWVEKGEKNNGYFLGLEKHRQQNNAITKLKIDETIESNDSVILKRIRTFYKDLYTNKECDNVNLDRSFNAISNLTTLTEMDKQFLDKDLNIGELDETIKNLKENKSPGFDGLSPEFF